MASKHHNRHESSDSLNDRTASKPIISSERKFDAPISRIRNQVAELSEIVNDDEVYHDDSDNGKKNY